MNRANADKVAEVAVEAAAMYGGSKLAGAVGNLVEGELAAGGATKAIGFADDVVASAYQGMNSGGGHAMRHLIREGLIPDVSNFASKARAFQKLTSPILRNPGAAFDWRLGNMAARAFAGEAGGRPLVVFIAKEGPFQ